MDNKPVNIETSLAVKPVSDDQDDVFTHTNHLWCPKGRPLVYGGALMSQALHVAMHRVSSGFLINSMHCHFIHPATTEKPVFYHVHVASEKKTFTLCHVSAKQNDCLLFTATLTFARDPDPERKMLEHAMTKPDFSVDPAAIHRDDGQGTSRGLFEWMPAAEPINNDSPETKQFRRLVRVQKRVTQPVGSKEHLIALACITDSWCLVTVGKAHGLSLVHTSKNNEANNETGKKKALPQSATLSHTIHFHNPSQVDVNEWMTEELHSPWAGRERGMVTSRLWTREGVLIATCYQEILVRLREEGGSKL